MTEYHLYQPADSDWETMPTDLDEAVERYLDDVCGAEPFVAEFEEWSATPVSIGPVDGHIEWLGEHVEEWIVDGGGGDVLFSDHFNKVWRSDEVQVAFRNAFQLVQSKITYLQADKVIRRWRFRFTPADGDDGGWEWKPIG